jgi:hypothetical protein
VRRTHSGTDRAGGGSYERPFILLAIFGPDGLHTRLEYFDADHDAEALARFDELVPSPAEGLVLNSAEGLVRSREQRRRVERPADPPPAAPFANAATRFCDAFLRCWDARDWEGVVAMLAPTVRVIDRRRLTGLDLEGSDLLASLRIIYEWPGSRWHRDLLATRAERLALLRCRVQSEDGAGALAELEYVEIVEVDSAGRGVLDVVLEPDDLDAAYAELDARYAAGEAAPHAATWEADMRLRRAAAARDWAQLGAAFAPDFVLEDHRPLGFLASLSREEYVASVRALLDLRPDARLRVDHVLGLDDRRSLTLRGWVGADTDGTFEISAAVVAEHGADGIRRWHFYDLDQLDAARARFAAVGESGEAADTSRGKGDSTE